MIRKLFFYIDFHIHFNIDFYDMFQIALSQITELMIIMKF